MSKILVAYFSASGVSKQVANYLCESCKGTLYEIKAQIPYTESDLNWRNSNSRVSKEIHYKSIRPPLADSNAQIEKFDIILLSFPIWWYLPPLIIYSFLESYNFQGKKIILFPTSHTSGLGQIVSDLKKHVDNTTVIIQGKVSHGNITKKEIENWLKEIKL